MRDVIEDVVYSKVPRVMTSTFRGRGDKVKGQIFRPQSDTTAKGGGLMSGVASKAITLFS